MPISISIHKQPKHITCSMTGKISFTEIRSGFEPLSNDSNPYLKMPLVCDLRCLDISSLDEHIMEEISRFFYGLYRLHDNTKVALVVKDDLQSGIFGMFRLYVDQDLITLNIFHSVGKAVNWVVHTDPAGQKLLIT